MSAPKFEHNPLCPLSPAYPYMIVGESAQPACTCGATAQQAAWNAAVDAAKAVLVEHSNRLRDDIHQSAMAFKLALPQMTDLIEELRK